MATFILTWSPDAYEFDQDEYDDYVEQTASGQTIEGNWSTGNRRSLIQRGDRAFLLRQHSERGIIASGEFISPVDQHEHWDGSDRKANYADIRWEHWLHPDDRLPLEVLLRRLPRFPWRNLQGSGVHVRDHDDAAVLEQLWEAHLESVGRHAPMRLPDEIQPAETFLEGAVTRIQVNRYERDPRARAACLNHWGYDCTVCGFNFARTYGFIGADYIHVHHLRELSSLGPGYEVDPIADLRPVCPNCHAMAHRRRPALTVEELQTLLRAAEPHR